jgi:hypothetical protein
MDALGPLLHAFYEGNLQPVQRSSAHAQLVAAMAEDGCAAAADAYVQRAEAALMTCVDGNGRIGTVLQPDSLLLHYALHALEVRARVAFSTTSPHARVEAARNATNLVVAAFAWNRNMAAGVTSPCGASPTAVCASGVTGGDGAVRSPSVAAAGSACGLQPVPGYIIAKAARVAVELGKREWIADATTQFPRMMLALIDQNGHSAASPPRIFAGMTILTTFVDDVLDNSRVDLRAADRAVLSKRIASIAEGVVAALEVGLRMRGPDLPTATPAAAARTLGSIVRIAPHVVADAIQVLRRAVLSRYDRVSSEALAVLAELYSESKIALPGPWGDVLAHLGSLLDDVAMGEAATGHSEALTLYRKRLASYAEAVISRSIASECDTRALERALNGLMGCTMRWAAEATDSFPDALNAWIGVLESTEDAEIAETKLLQTAYGVVAKLCLERCMFTTNCRVLRALERVEDDEFEHNGSEESMTSIFNEELADTIADIGTNPSALSSTAFLTSGLGADDAAGAYESGMNTDGSAAYRAEYISKCIDTIAFCARLVPETLGIEVSSFACKVLTELSAKQGLLEEEVLEDQRTAAAIACAVAPLLPVDSSAAQLLTRTVITLLSSTSSAAPAPKRYLSLLRAATCLVPALSVSSWSERSGLARVLAQSARHIIILRDGPVPARSVVVSATVVLLSLNHYCRELVFVTEPPVTASMLTAVPHHVVVALALVGMVRWTLEPDLGSSGQAPRPEEWAGRMAVFQSGWRIVLEPYMRCCMLAPERIDLASVLIIARGASILRSVFWCVYAVSNARKEALWNGVARDSSDMSIRVLRHLSSLLSSNAIDSEAKQTISNCIGVLVGSLGCMLRVFRRQVNAESQMVASEVVQIALEATTRSQSMRLAHSILILLREQLGEGFSKEKEYLVGPSIALAVQSLDGDVDVAIAGVGVLGETLIRHWLMFWPGDTVLAPSINGSTQDVGAARGKLPTSDHQQAYNQALSGILGAIAKEEPSVSRAGMLMLESIHAARKLYSRDAGFRALGGAACVVSACLGAMSGARASLADEAVAVIWGVAKADWEAFYANGVVEHAVRSTRACAESQARELATAFGNPTDRPTFSRALVTLVNDLGFHAAMREGLAL